MLVPALGPMALAGTVPQTGMHCMRQPLPENRATAAAAPVMHCHDAGAMGGATAATESSSFEKTIRSVDCCCPNHDCCRGLKTSERASIASNTISPGYFLVEPAAPIRVLIHVSDVFAGPDSARAPPLL